MKIFLRIIVWLVAISILTYGYKNIPIKKIGEEISQKIYLDRTSSKFLPDWTQDEVFQKVNEARQSAGFTKVKLNDKLNKAALSRLSVILTENDYSGAATGLTREVAVKNSGYSAGVIGDLLLLRAFKTSDSVAGWMEDKTLKESLLHPDVREVGIAVKNEDNKVSVYVVLVSPSKPVAVAKKVTWGGVELWNEVNKRRVELGVNQMSTKEELCTLASIRLNQLLELRKLDGHAGFVPLLNRADLKWISEKYNISEYLAEGYETPAETVKAWESTLGHRSLLAGGEYVWGCVYAQNSFAVAIAAY